METAELQVTSTELMGPKLERLQRGAMIVAVVGLAVTAVGAFLDLDGFFHAYLYAYLFWFGVTTGSLALLMLHHTVGGGWGYLLRAFLEAATRLLPVMAVLFIPVIIGLLPQFGLYKWTLPNAASDPIIDAKSPYLNAPFFIGRTVLYFLIWIGLATCFNKWGAIQYERDDRANFTRLTIMGAAGIIIYVLSITFAGVDWIMSLEPYWVSSIFGMLTVVMQGLSTLALMLCLLAFLGSDPGRPRGLVPLLERVPTAYFRDLGNLTLAFVMLWAYMSFSQYLITYSGNTAEEVVWYNQRAEGGWGYLSLALIPLHFIMPFMVLLVGSRIKKDPRRMAQVAAFLIVMRFVDLFWYVTPTFRSVISVGVADLGTPLLLGGIWLWLWAGQLKDRPLVPVHDPRLEESLEGAMQHG